MCSPASMVVTKDRVFWSAKSDSHEDIIEEFNLRERTGVSINIARVEITPNNGDLHRPIDEWVFALDQDLRPDWYNAEEVEARARQQLQAWRDKKVFVSGVHKVRNGQAYACGSSTVKAYDSSTVTAYDSSTVRACGSSTVTAYGSSTVKAWDSSTVRAYDSSTVRAYGSSTVRAYGGSTVTAYGSSTVRAYGSSTVKAWDSSTVTAYDSSTVRAYDGSTVRACGNSTVKACGSSTVTACESFATVRAYGSKGVVVPTDPFAVVIDCTGKKAKCIVGK